MKTNGKYDYLQLIECVYDQGNNECTFLFLFPESKNEMDNCEREEILHILKKELSLNSKIHIKFKKSYLDFDIIKRQTLSIIKQKYPSISANLKLEDIVVENKDDAISVVFYLEKNIYNFFNSQNLAYDLANDLKDYFISKFVVGAKKNLNNEINSDILKKRESEIDDKFFQNTIAKTERYEVSDLSMIFGSEITPKPEYIKSIKTEKPSVILSGIVSFFQKRSYVKKKEKAKGSEVKESHYYTFLLDDGSGKINVTYFCPKTIELKMDKIVDGTRIIVVGDVQKYGEKLTLYLKSLGLCENTTNPHIKEIRTELSTPENRVIENYKLCFPKPYVATSQANLFEKSPIYSNYIMENKFVIYDFETTSLSAESGEIIEIGAVKIENGKIVNCFQSLIKPKEPVSDFTTSLTGITNDMLSDAPNSKVVIEDFSVFCSGSIMGGYNNLKFDNLFLQALAKKHNLVFDNSQIDVMNLAISKLNLKRYTLSSVVDHLNIMLIDAHRALNDAIATAKAFLKLNEQ